MHLTLPNNNHQVNCQWLAKHLAHPDLVVLDASMDNPVNQHAAVSNLVIEGALRFDFSNDIVAPNTPSPNMMPNAELFQQKVKDLGINQSSTVIVYDKNGLFSAARAWFMFKTMGFDNVAILQGGLPAWCEANLPTQSTHSAAKHLGNFEITDIRHLFVDKQYVLNAITDEQKQIVDARGYGRFSGKEAEPREGMRSGHIPNSLNLHYAKLVSEGHLLGQEQLKKIFSELTPSPDEFIFSCGSGVTACILALAAEISGFEQVKVYDGSWSEWGADKLLPIDKI